MRPLVLQRAGSDAGSDAGNPTPRQEGLPGRAEQEAAGQEREGRASGQQ